MYRVKSIESRNGYRTVTVTFTSNSGEVDIERSWAVGDGVSEKDIVADYGYICCISTPYVGTDPDAETIRLANGKTLTWTDVLRERAGREAYYAALELSEAEA